jgi:hypothetical protein
MKLWQLKYIIGVVFLSSHLLAGAVIWLVLTPRPLGEEDARTLFFIILPLTSFYTISFVKDVARRQFVDQFYENAQIAPWSGYLQIGLVLTFALSILALLIGFDLHPYEFSALKSRFGIVDAIYTSMIGAISENLFGYIQAPGIYAKREDRSRNPPATVVIPHCSYHDGDGGREPCT